MPGGKPRDSVGCFTKWDAKTIPSPGNKSSPLNLTKSGNSDFGSPSGTKKERAASAQEQRVTEETIADEAKTEAAIEAIRTGSEIEYDNVPYGRGFNPNKLLRDKPEPDKRKERQEKAIANAYFASLDEFDLSEEEAEVEE